MSYHLHLRAVPPADVRPDGAWLEAFMWASWADHHNECTAGIADSIEKDFGRVNQLYTGTPDGPEDAADPSGLPIYGGELVFHGDGPPFVILRPDRVREAALFLRTADFDALWTASGTALQDCGDLALDRENYLSHHHGLATFYRTAARSGNAVVKAFWF
ncbi:DUF1877 family protein [Kitasatospora sp. NPDC004614]|uniref:DUF1877 family protein n=1 Tax=unclassified Kitasatospora TaxID=2633591 RepID=UPI0036761D95